MIEKMAIGSLKVSGVICIAVFALFFLPMTILIYLLVHEPGNWLDELEELGSIGIVSLSVVAQVLWLYIILAQIV